MQSANIPKRFIEAQDQKSELVKVLLNISFKNQDFRVLIWEKH